MKTHSQNAKNARIDLRVNAAQKALLEQAAATQGKNLSEFVIQTSTQAAQLALADQNRFTMPQEQLEEFLRRLESDPEDNPALRKLFERKSVFQ